MIIENIWADISAEIPIGTFDEDSELLEKIEEEVMKIGSLQHGEIKWEDLKSNCISYLSNECKDYRILGHLTTCLINEKTEESYVIALKIFKEFNLRYLKSSYPDPNQKTFPIKRTRALLLIFNKLLKVFDETLFEQSSQKSLKEIENEISIIKEQVQGHPKLEEIVTKLLNKAELQKECCKLEQKPQNEKINKHTQAAVSAKKNKQSNHVKTEAKKERVIATDDMSFENSRSIKQSYLILADYTNDIAPENKLGYEVRRFGLWHHINTLPEADLNGTTQMFALPNGKALDYKLEINNNPTLDTLKRLEKTITTSPFWIEGSYLSALCAQNLNLDDVSDAILQSTKDFVGRFNNFYQLKFQDATPFIPDDIKDWLETEMYKASVSQGLSKSETFNDRYNEVYLSEGILSAYKMMENDFSVALDEKNKFYIKLEKIELYIAEGMSTIASEELKQVELLVSQLDIKQWDASFFQKIEQLKKRIK